MSTGKSVNVAASIRQRLKNQSNKDKRPFNELLQYYAMERFLYRLSQSEHAEIFILKGALMLRAWRSPEVRPTMDIDMLGRTSNDEGSIITQIKDIISTEAEPDGLIFDSDSIRAERITEDADYEGIRVRFVGRLDGAQIHMQIDIGFGDIVHPEAVMTELPTILDSPIPKLLCYSRESAIAEKFQAMLKLGELNSRMKDFYDIWLLSRQFDFNGTNLMEAIRLTLSHRGTTIPTDITAFSKGFVDAKQVQWTAFSKRLGQEHVPNFSDIVSAVEAFIQPVASAIASNSEPPSSWASPDTWK